MALCFALLAPVLIACMPVDSFWRPDTQVWSAPVASGGAVLSTVAIPSFSIELSNADLRGINWLALVGFGGALLWVLYSCIALGLRLRRLTPWRRLGRVELSFCSHAGGAFAAWWPGRIIVALDAETIAHRDDRLIAVRHELQHHRHLDPAFAWLWLGLRAAFWWNPAVHWLAHQMSELEEMAVDAALVCRGVDAKRYGESLLRAATRVAAKPRLSRGFKDRGYLLTRRIEMLTQTGKRQSVLWGALVAALLTTAAAWAADSVHTREVDEDLAEQAMESLEAAGWDVHSSTTRAVLAELVEGRAGRQFARGAIAAAPEYEAIIGVALNDYNLPQFLRAVPFIESGYQNLGAEGGQSMAPGRGGRGIWMFIPQTARHYGLEVSDEIDQRLDIKEETDAAMRLLQDLYAEFGDWGLALAGYNQGAKAVRVAIKQGGTVDIFKLIEAGLLNEYAARVAAAAILLEAPELLGESPAERRLTVHLIDADLNETLQLLAEQADMDLVFKGQFKSKVSISVKDAEWQSVLDLILKHTSLKAEQSGSKLIIYSEK